MYKSSRDDTYFSGCGAAGSALDWGSRGREFKSRHSDHLKESENVDLSRFLGFFVFQKIGFVVCLVFIALKNNIKITVFLTYRSGNTVFFMPLFQNKAHLLLFRLLLPEPLQSCERKYLMWLIPDYDQEPRKPF